VGVAVNLEGTLTPTNKYGFLSLITRSRLASFHELDELYTFYIKPLACLLFKPSRSKSISLYSLSENALSIFPLEASITIKGFLVRRRQVPIYLAFCLTAYKVQGTTPESAILDLKNNRKIRG
jgi:hypothetical protein